MKLSRT